MKYKGNPIKWKDIKCGYIIEVKEDEVVPADMVLIHSSAAKGSCYVETKSLDGETNLKMKSARREVYEHFEGENIHEAVASFNAKVDCEPPNNAIYKFEGTVTLDDEVIPLGAESLLLRGMNIRNTEKVYGLVVYTGHDTKVMKNTSAAKHKFSKLETMMNKSIVIVLSTQFLLAFVGAIWGVNWKQKFTCTGEGCDPVYAVYMPQNDDIGGFELIIMIGTWILLMTNMVPISLMVSLEVVK